MNTILHPTDFTADCEQTFLLACSVARGESAELIVLHVVSPESCLDEYRDGDQLDRDSEVFQSCWIQFERLRELADDIPIAFQVKVGRPVSVIVRVAQRECCDLIVLAAHQHCFTHYQFHGSVSESVVRQAPCPVFCLRQSPVQQQPRRVLDGLERQLQYS